MWIDTPKTACTSGPNWFVRVSCRLFAMLLGIAFVSWHWGKRTRRIGCAGGNHGRWQMFSVRCLLVRDAGVVAQSPSLVGGHVGLMNNMQCCLDMIGD